MGDLWYFIKRKQENISKIHEEANGLYVDIDEIVNNLKKGNETYRNHMSKKFGEDYIHNPKYNKFINGILF